ncbi:MAG: cytochrome c oxidase subunit II [Anaerolineae bacterium]|nr:cytochrome c oxidase subunit II [Caldilineales bacterium]MCX7852125.1 cytochrome c oxidase subunit II [Caldilineales bacterium]MDW8268375.1 cytochrome c oxidase subunit II [Anaerolineae bacterium]
MRHAINVTVIILVSIFALLFIADNVQWMPVQASAEAKLIDWLFNLHIDIIVVLYVLVNGILLYSVFVFRRKKDDPSEGVYFHGNTRLEILWTVIPLIVVVYFAVLGAGVLRQTLEAADDELEVVVTARQWAWTFEYPEWGIASTELNLPVDRRVHLVLHSEDVTHSFWVPEFRLKQDTVPGQEHHLRLTPTRVGTYKVRCAELCGTSHAYMEAPVNVMTAEDFEIWRQKRLGIYVPPEGEEAPAEDPVALGQRLATSAGCIACHSLDGSALVGPTWKGIFGKTETMADGSTVVVDEAYLHESIVNPSAKLVAGFQDLMPKNYGDILTEAEINALIEYIKTIR